MNYFSRLSIVLLVMGIFPATIMAYDIRNGATIELRAITKTFTQQQDNLPRDVNLWVYCLSGVPTGTSGECAAPTYPGPLLELGVGQTATVTLDLSNVLTPTEDGQVASIANFSGHTIHFANLDLPSIHDGVPAPFPSLANTPPTNTAGHTYTIDLGSSNPGHVGGHAYYCHVHQTKHVEMGEFGALLVRPITTGGVFINTINQAGPSYDVEANFVLSTIYPDYHFFDIVGEDPVFASYSPTIFLVNGTEGLATATPAVAISAVVNQTVAIRLIGMHAVNATFQIVDNVTNNILGTAQNFELHNIDGWAQTPTTVSSIDISPGQTKDILITMPAAATTWYPVVTYKHLRDDAVLANVFSAITVQ